MIEEERYFTIKEVAKLLGVSKTSIKRRIESKNLIAYKRLGKRGFELVIPQRELSVEIMGSMPDSRQLSLCEFETIVIKRFKAMAAGRDRRTSLTLKLLCEEFAQLRAEIKTLNFSTAEDDSPAISLKRERLSTRQENELARSSQLQSPYPVLRFSNHE
jgi:excisionase family DNA binding protein